MEIKEATANDWEQVKNLYLSLLKTDPSAFADEYDEVILYPKEKWIEELSKKDGKVFVAFDGGLYIGMGRIDFYKEIPGIPVIHKFGVLSEYRRKGVAKSLIHAQEKWAKKSGFAKARLYVMADRMEAIDFWKKNGYVQTEFLKNNVKKSDGTFLDIVVMEKAF